MALTKVRLGLLSRGEAAGRRVCWGCCRGQAASDHGRRGGVPGRLTGQRRLTRAVEDDVVRFRLPALLPFDFEPGGVHRSNQAEVASF